jgi:hypothetical protein
LVAGGDHSGRYAVRDVSESGGMMRFTSLFLTKKLSKPAAETKDYK